MIDPIAFTIFGWPIYWYGLSYVAGFLYTYWFIKQFHQIKKLTNEVLEDIFFYTALFSVIGGRIFEIIFYNVSYYLANPLKIFAVWEGGMSIHGGITFAIITLYWQAKKHKINPLELFDIFSIPATIALAIGRITNFINQELIGKVTDSIFGVIVPNYDNQPRHPYTLYLAFKNMLVFATLFAMSQTKKKLKPGTISAWFLILFNGGRFLLDTFKIPDVKIWILTQGQILSLLFIIAGILLLYKINNKK